MTLPRNTLHISETLFRLWNTLRFWNPTTVWWGPHSSFPAVVQRPDALSRFEHRVTWSSPVVGSSEERCPTEVQVCSRLRKTKFIAVPLDAGSTGPCRPVLFWQRHNVARHTHVLVVLLVAGLRLACFCGRLECRCRIFSDAASERVTQGGLIVIVDRRPSAFCRRIGPRKAHLGGTLADFPGAERASTPHVRTSGPTDPRTTGHAP